ncbi:MAG TPA: protease inhibitor I42 family protein [Terriglobia bacterium]|nr:protease inhibitor I42 family protein [Terriglobia bacterium]
MIKLDEAGDGREIGLAPGEQLEVTLAENRTTGYKWEIASGGSRACSLINESAQPGASIPGAGGKHIWVFQAGAGGSELIELVYRRAWEADTPPSRSFRITVKVAPQPA